MPEQPTSTFLINARLIDGTGAPPRADSALRLEGERIADVGHRRAFGELPAGARVIDAGGRTVMPGLIESHIHLSFTDGPFASPLADPRVPPDYIAIQAAHIAERALQAGYTSVRSCGSTFFV